MEKNKGKVSIIIPVYNMEKYLSRCVESVLSQTYTDLQIILVDDGSTDSSAQMCDEYALRDSRIRVVHKENGGLSSARNAGLEVATGKYIGFVDSDDYISPDFYESLVNAIGDKTTEIANGRYARVDENGNLRPSCVPHERCEDVTPVCFAKELMLHVGDVSVCSKLFPSELLSDLRFNEDKLNEDLLFILDILSKIEVIHFTDVVGYFYYIRSGSISSRYGKAIIDMVENSLIAKNFIDSKFPELVRVTERFVLYQHMAYLLAIPKAEAARENTVFRNAVRYIRRHIWQMVTNPYLKLQNKVLIIALAAFPHLAASFYRKRKGK